MHPYLSHYTYVEMVVVVIEVETRTDGGDRCDRGEDTY